MHSKDAFPSRETDLRENNFIAVIFTMTCISKCKDIVKIWKDEADLRTVRSSQRSINFESENTEYVCY